MLDEGGGVPAPGTSTPAHTRAVLDELEARVERHLTEASAQSRARWGGHPDDVPDGGEGLGEPPD